MNFSLCHSECSEGSQSHTIKEMAVVDLFLQQTCSFALFKMEKKKPEIDIINEVLEACLLAYPVSSFVISLYKQYLERGSLSKKQLQGLYGKAQNIQDFSPAKLATLEARIKKMPTRFKSEVPVNKPLYEKEESTGQLIDAVLAKYPQHKAVLFMKAKYERNEKLTTTELADLKRFYQLATKAK